MTRAGLARAGSPAVVLLAGLLLAGCAEFSSSRRESADAHYRLATAYLQQSGGIQSEVNRRKAYPELIEAIRLDPQHAGYHKDLGTIFFYNEDFETAERETKKAIALDPNMAEAQNNLGLVYLAQGRHAEAARQFQRALGNLSYATPEYAYNNLGKTCYLMGDFSAAVDALERSLAILPSNEEARFVLAMSYVKLGRLVEAEKAFRAALQLRQNAPRTHYELGMVLFKLNRKVEAAEQFRHVVALDPQGEFGEQSRTYLKLLR